MPNKILPHNNDNELAASIDNLAQAIVILSNEKKTEFEWFKSHLQFATKNDLKEMENKIMSAISDYAAAQNTKLDALATSVDGIVADVAFLKAKIEALQNSTGTVNAEDQALLDSLQNRIGTLADKVKALDDATDSSQNPPPPVEPTP